MDSDKRQNSWWADVQPDQFYATCHAEQPRMRNTILPEPLQKLFAMQLELEARQLLLEAPVVSEVDDGTQEGGE